MVVGFPMQTADGEVVFPVGRDFTLTADQILKLLETGELHAEGVRRLVAPQAATPMRRHQTHWRRSPGNIGRSRRVLWLLAGVAIREAATLWRPGDYGRSLREAES